MSDEVNRNVQLGTAFWDAYRQIVAGHGIPAGQVDWFLRWAQDFAKSRSNVKLRERGSTDVMAYIQNLARRRGIKEWQVKQAVMALQFLCTDHLRLTWSGKWEWDKTSELGMAIAAKAHAQPSSSSPAPAPTSTPALAAQLYQGQPFPDLTPSQGEREKHQPILNKLRTALRTRHYSIRTEQAYESWLLRFLTFCEKRRNANPGPGGVREYL
ncbi:MAG TPA: phage integrase N-terminal SAM-like domain-containing protein [Desulfurivibrionaceae bacterium]|nr:phage integrase N-terminal SAM-like domain-containing protein [Desulfurivibrionaceae bacterium]